MLSILVSIVFSTFLFDASNAHAFLPNAKMPVCMSGGDEMKIDNARVVTMKNTTQNQFHDRGFVQGTVTIAPTKENGHDHFSLSIGPNAKDTVEIVYNYDAEFGPMMTGVNVGDTVTVCGDYITSFAAGGGYPPSSEGALIHWSHYNPASRSGSLRHEHGFIMIGSNLAGFDEAPAASWDGTVVQPSGGQTRTDGNRPPQPKKPKNKKKHFDSSEEESAA